VDRRHQAPLASFTGTSEWQVTNHLSNITPQQSGLNQGPWERLEREERTLARRPNITGVYVLTGPIYTHPMPAQPRADEAHRIPSAYWKIVAVDDAAGIRTASFIMGQSEDTVSR
jgi:endonuclease G